MGASMFRCIATVVTAVLLSGAAGAAETRVEVVAGLLRAQVSVLPANVVTVEWMSGLKVPTMSLDGDSTQIAALLAQSTGASQEVDSESNTVWLFQDTELRELMQIELPTTGPELMSPLVDVASHRLEETNKVQKRACFRVGRAGDFSQRWWIEQFVSTCGTTQTVQRFVAELLRKEPRLYCNVVAHRLKGLSDKELERMYAKEVASSGYEYLVSIGLGLRARRLGLSEPDSLEFRARTFLDPARLARVQERGTSYVRELLVSDKEAEREEGVYLLKLTDDFSAAVNSTSLRDDPIGKLRFGTAMRYVVAGRWSGSEEPYLQAVASAGKQVRPLDKAEVAVLLALMNAPSAAKWLAATASDAVATTASAVVKRRYAEALAVLSRDRGYAEGVSAAGEMFCNPDSASAAARVVRASQAVQKMPVPALTK